MRDFINFFYQLKKFLKKDQIIIIRSSIYPGICNKIYKIIESKCKNLSYCPERIVQGKAILELPKLPQLVSGKNKKAILESGKLFRKVCKKIIYTKVIEAELIKLFSNAYRYINFSISNQFYMIGLGVACYATAATAKNRNMVIQFGEFIKAIDMLFTSSLLNTSQAFFN